MTSEEERREVARRLREWTWKSAPAECLLNQLVFGDDCPGTDDDPDTIDCHQCEVIAAKRLADLIDPGESGQNLDKNRDTVQIESPAVQKAPECDRDALLALADKMRKYARLRSSMGMDVDAMAVGAWVLRIREACGEVVG